ncbi:hypothetical protein [Aeromonas hydrophila]|uniref:hypothetical protein n=1 Tax=Aeromonas hydrophila TaxID=644 RepID=UPI0035B9EFB8
MKKQQLFIAILGAIGLAGPVSADTLASQTFSWGGVVPVASTQQDWVVRAATGANINVGSLTFSNYRDGAGKGKLVGSTPIVFNVFKYDSAASKVKKDEPAASYTYELQSLTITRGGVIRKTLTGDSFFEVLADGTPLKFNDATNSRSGGGAVALTVAESKFTKDQPDAGEYVNVQAAIVVTAAS